MSAPGVIDLRALAAQQPFQPGGARQQVNRIARRIEEIEDARIAARRQALLEEQQRSHAASEQAYRSGYRSGTHWGLFCGWVAGIVFAGLVIGAWQALRPDVLRLLIEWAPALLPHTGLVA